MRCMVRVEFDALSRTLHITPDIGAPSAPCSSAAWNQTHFLHITPDNASDNQNCTPYIHLRSYIDELPSFGVHQAAGEDSCSSSSSLPNMVTASSDSEFDSPRSVVADSVYPNPRVPEVVD